MAYGADGVFAPSAPWVLTSATVNDATNGVATNRVILVSAPIGQYSGGSLLLAVDSVSGNSVTLRWLHNDLNVGQPPAPAAGLSGVTFTINTLDPQTEEAPFDIKRRFGIDENILYRSSTWVYDERDLRMATVLTVTYDRYTAEARTDRGFQRKISMIRSQLDQVLDRVQVRWGRMAIPPSHRPSSIASPRGNPREQWSAVSKSQDPTAWPLFRPVAFRCVPSHQWQAVPPN